MGGQGEERRTLGLAFGYGAVLSSMMMDVVVKHVSASVGTWTLMFWRWSFAVLLLLPIVVMRRGTGPVSPLRKVHAWRAVLNIVGSFCLFHSLATLDLSVVVSLFFVEPILTAVCSRLVSEEAVGPTKWIATVLGLCGVVAVTFANGPGVVGTTGALSWDSMVAVLGAACWAVMTVLTRRDGREVSSIVLVFWLAVSTSLMSLLFARTAIVSLTTEDLLYLGLTAALGSLYSALWVSAAKLAPASEVGNLLYLAMPFSYLAGLALFQERASIVAVLGSTLILCVNVVVANRSLERRIDEGLHKVWRLI